MISAFLCGSAAVVLNQTFIAETHEERRDPQRKFNFGHYLFFRDALAMDLLIGTGNRGKVREILEALKYLRLTLYDLTQFPTISVPLESGASYEENATIKARHYAKQSGLWALADDSGLEVTALNGAPGVKSARFRGDHASDSDRVGLLLTRMSDVPTAMRQATFVCVMVIAEPGGRLLHVGEGKCQGILSTSPAGQGGFGYDPIFVPDGYEQSFGELPSTIKNKISHRARALASVREFLMVSNL